MKRSMSTRRVVVVSASVALITASIGLWNFYASRRSHDAAVSRAGERTAAEARTARRVLEDLEETAVPVGELGTSAPLWSEHLQKTAVVIAPHSLPNREETLAALYDDASQFLARRLGGISLDEYVAWRREVGYVLLDIASPAGKRIMSDYEMLSGEPAPDDMELIFRSRAQAQIGEGAGREGSPDLVGTGRGSAVIAINFSDVESHPDYPMLAGGLGDLEFWQGGNAYSFGRSWLPPRSYHELLGKNGKSLVATVGMAVRFGPDDWRVLYMNYLYDPGSKRWYLAKVSHYHAPDPDKIRPWLD